MNICRVLLKYLKIYCLFNIDSKLLFSVFMAIHKKWWNCVSHSSSNLNFINCNLHSRSLKFIRGSHKLKLPGKSYYVHTLNAEVSFFSRVNGLRGNINIYCEIDRINVHVDKQWTSVKFEIHKSSHWHPFHLMLRLNKRKRKMENALRLLLRVSEEDDDGHLDANCFHSSMWKLKLANRFVFLQLLMCIIKERNC